MRAVIQRVTSASVTVEDQVVGRIDNGLCVLLGIEQFDTQKDINYLADKILNLRIFEDENGKMNISLLDIKGELLVVSQFTLYGDCKNGKRPSYDRAAKPDVAKVIYEDFVRCCKEHNVKVETGIFQAMMLVDIKNDGPVTLLIDSRKEF